MFCTKKINNVTLKIENNKILELFLLKYDNYYETYGY